MRCALISLHVASHLDVPAPTAPARGSGSCSAPTATAAAWGGHREKGMRMQMASVQSSCRSMSLFDAFPGTVSQTR
eukprot:3437364-Alexandrium_andersonii.AAC.1